MSRCTIRWRRQPRALELIPPAPVEQQRYGLVDDAADALGRISIAPTLDAAVADGALV